MSVRSIKSAMDVEHTYERLAPIYDVIYGTLLQPGRRRAMARLAPRGGETILEVGVGTGFGLRQYPATCRVTGIDLSASMIDVARDRAKRQRLPNVSLSRMDAALLAFADAQFDAVYAPYVVNVVSDPIQVAREMRRVCRPGGRLVFLNHFDGLTDNNPMTTTIGRMASTIAGVNWHLDFGEFIRATGLKPQSIDAVNAAQVSAVVLCVV
jgi:phosphatidylethanolamine/phosphatidyl-N-methylethanolamine N-methyltransferase